MSWFRRRLPIPLDDKYWVDEWMLALRQYLPTEYLLSNPTVVPSGEFFPTAFDGSEAGAVQLFCRIAELMGVDTSDMKLEFVDEDPSSELGEMFGTGERSGAAGTWSRPMRTEITLARYLLENPVGLVATSAHELCHELLMPNPEFPSDHPKMELVTDLATFFMGFGYFTANTVVQSRTWSEGLMSGWSVSRSGYLNEGFCGYALALTAATRGEWKPVWTKGLAVGVRDVFVKSLRYLRKTGDSVLLESLDRSRS